MYKKSLKAVFKLQRALSSSNPSISTFLHLYDHTIKPILIYGSEITGMFKTPLSILSILNQYLNIDKTTEKYRGYLPSSDNTAKFVDVE
jgi:hypothetical protein